jgi:hypothetical protein
MPSKYVEELRAVIKKLHGVDSRHVDSVPVKEVFRGQTVWDGMVEIFEIRDHPKTSRIFAWSHQTDNPDKPRRHVTVLALDPVVTPVDAVRAALIQESRSVQTEEA